MRVLLILAAKELRDGLRNRWVAAAILLLATLALSLAFLGSAPIGSVKAAALDITTVSLASLTVYLLPLIALMLAFDAFVGEAERGTLLLLLAYPVARWQVVLGKFLGHTTILALAILIGYGVVLPGLSFAGEGPSGDWPSGDWPAFAAMMASSLLLGAAFLGLGYLPSVLVRERATAAGVAIALWLLFVVLYDLALLGLLIADQSQMMGQGLISALLLINPTDAYRVFNLAGSEGVSLVSGLAGEIGFGPGLPLLMMLAWVALPLTSAVLLFRRKEI